MAQDPSAARFPADLKITVYRTNAEIAGNRAIVRYYFHEDSFFRQLYFEDLKSYDFNYNVFRSVNEYNGNQKSYTGVCSRYLRFAEKEIRNERNRFLKGLIPERCL